jgi:hypothetical protein
MTERDQTGPSERAALAAGLFARLVDCYDRGDFSRAADAQGRLLRLGWSILRRAPRTKPKPRPEAPGREGTR